MNIEADILFTVHRVPPSCRSMVLTLLITYSKGAPFYNAIARQPEAVLVGCSRIRASQTFPRYFRSNTITIGLSWPGMCFVIVKVFRSAESPI